MPYQSTPWCCQKRWSSMAMTASCSSGPTSLQRDVLAVLLAVQLGYLGAVGGVDLGGLGELLLLEVLETGQADAGVEPDEEAAHHQSHAQHEDEREAQQDSHRVLPQLHGFQIHYTH